MFSEHRLYFNVRCKIVIFIFLVTTPRARGRWINREKVIPGVRDVTRWHKFTHTHTPRHTRARARREIIISLFPIKLLLIPCWYCCWSLVAQRSCFAVFYLEPQRFDPCFHFGKHFRRFDAASRKITPRWFASALHIRTRNLPELKWRRNEGRILRNSKLCKGWQDRCPHGDICGMIRFLKDCFW